ncbi:MAG: tRNA glutamyl-Q(34) synthetase GluQRS [Polyangiales bacterium]
MSAGYRGRLAPSPTGELHLGIARTSLCAWLRARAAGGTLVLRIEDIDTPRVVAGSAESIMRDLRWLGIDWDEGPDIGGPHGPYLQSQRMPRYEAAIAQLTTHDWVFPCTCSRKEIASIASAPHGHAELGPVYPGTCRAGALHPERAAALRFKHRGAAPAFDDVLAGPYRDGLIDDFVLRRADGVIAYQLAVVADDIAMQISEVVRGDDLLSSTPRQLALYAALEATPPGFLHLPLVVAPDGRRLAKREGARSISEFRARGASAAEIVGWLAHSLGLAAAGEALLPAQLVPRFELSRLPLTAATFDASRTTFGD